MDILPVFIQAAAVLGNAAANESAKRAVAKAWDSAVGVIKERLGSAHPAPALIETLPAAAGSGLQTIEIRDSLSALQVPWDAQMTAAIEKLAAALQQPATASSHTNTITTTVHGDYTGAQVVNGDVHFGSKGR